MQHRYWNGSSWSTWEDQGGSLASAPTVASWGKRRLDIFARGPDGQLWHKWFDDGWKQWENLGQPMIGPITEAPAAVSWGNKRIDIFVRGTGRQALAQVLRRRLEQLGGPRRRAPLARRASCAWGDRRLDVFCSGPDDALWHKWFKGTSGAAGRASTATSRTIRRRVVGQRAHRRVRARPNNTLQHRYFSD